MCPVDRDASVKTEKKKKKNEARGGKGRHSDVSNEEESRTEWIEWRVEHCRQTEKRCKIAKRSPPLDNYTRNIYLPDDGKGSSYWKLRA